MITQNINTLRNISLDFTGTKEELEQHFALLDFEMKLSKSKGVGLSCIQINIPVRVAIIRYNKTRINLYNAEIIRKEQPFNFEGEGCLSIPNVFCTTRRYNVIEVKNGDGIVTKYSGFISVAIQHEISHWNGEIFTDCEVKNT